MEQELIHDQVAAYAMDALDESERREFEEHRARCEQCSNELEGLQDAAAALAYVHEGPAPPPALRERLLEQVHEETTRAHEAPAAPRRHRLFAPVLAALAVGAVAAAVVLGLWASSLSNSVDTKNAALSVLANPASRRISLGVHNNVVIAPNGQAVLVSGLSRAPAGKTYELWVIDGKTAHPAGTFTKGTHGAPVMFSRRVPRGTQIGLSIEHAGGSQRPTQILFVSPVVT